MTEEMVLVLIRYPRNVLVSLYLRGSSGQEVDIHGVSSVIKSTKGAQMGGKMRVMTSMHGESMRW